MNFRKSYIKFFGLMCFFFVANSLYAQQSPYGLSNRIQYERLHFTQYPSKRFTLFIEQNSERLDSVLLHHTSNLIREVVDSLQLDLRNPFHIIVYSSTAHYAQGNIGLEFEQQQAGGVFEFHGNRIILCYKGSIATLLLDLKLELIRTLVRQSLYGNSAQEVLRSLERSELPVWLIDAFVHYLAVGFLPAEENRFHSILLSKHKVTFEECITLDAPLTGKALFYYLEQRYGRNTLRQWLFQLRTLSNLDKACKRLYKLNFDELGVNMLAFLSAQGIQNQTHFDTVANPYLAFGLKGKGTQNHTLLSLSQQKGVVWVQEKNDDFILWFQHVDIQKYKPTMIKKISSPGKHSPHPFIFRAQSKTNQLGLVYPCQGSLCIEIFVLDAKGKVLQTSKTLLREIDDIADIRYVEDEGILYLVATHEAKTELYSFSLRTKKWKKLSTNNADELEISEGMWQGEKGLYYTVSNLDSNGNSATELQFLPLTLHDNELTRTKISWTLAQNQFEDIKGIHYHEDGWVYFLSNRNGVMNLWRMLPMLNSSSQLEQLTQMDYDIERFIVDVPSVFLSITHTDSIVMVQVPLDSLRSKPLVNTSLRTSLLKQNNHIFSKKDTASASKGKENDYSFFKPSEVSLKESARERQEEQTFDTEKLKPYSLQLTSEYVSAGVDNTLLVNSYQPYAQNQGQFKQVPLGGMMRYAFTDLFEDYRAEIGFRIPSFTKGSDFFLQMDHRRDRLDWRFSYLRHSEKSSLRPDSNWQKNWTQAKPANYKQVLHYAEFGLAYPISIRSKIQFSTGFRYDKQYFLSLDTFSLRYPDTSQTWSLAKLAYVHDRTREFPNTGRLGFRSYFFVEFHYQLSKVQTGFTHAGFDVRYYKQLFKQTVWASKLNGAFSAGGTNGMMYVLGGTNNWLGPRIDSNATFLPSDNYSFTTYATSLRGSPQNVRYGNIYLLFNTEYRIPIRSTFNLPRTRLNSIDNVSLVPFFDCGNAWRGGTKNNTPTWVIGYGFGLHSTLLSYHVRFDLAWSSPSFQTSHKPMFVVGLGSEF